MRPLGKPSKKTKLTAQQTRRKWFQGLYLLGTNSYLAGFFKGTIYQGALKNTCLPGLNCYSCPGALGSCPLGALQNSLADPRQKISLYVLGFLTMTGALLGRAVCGWLCPFGWAQELLYKIQTPKLLLQKKMPGLHKALQQLKYVILLLFVILLPFIPTLSGQFGDPYFCKYICPSGMLFAGIPLVSVNAQLQALVGWLFGWKGFLLLVFLILATISPRPFCRYVCPLGAIYGFFNKVSAYRVHFEPSTCISCHRCTNQCPMAVPVPHHANVAECIRCGECAAVCPTNSLKVGFGGFAHDQKDTLRTNS